LLPELLDPLLVEVVVHPLTEVLPLTELQHLNLLLNLLVMSLHDLQLPVLVTVLLPVLEVLVVTEDQTQLKLEEDQTNAHLALKLYMKTNKLKPVVVFGIEDASSAQSVAYPST
jgi:hypothetical protein